MFDTKYAGLKKKSFIIALIIIISSTYLSIQKYFLVNHEEYLKPFLVDSASLKSTIIAPNLETTIERDKNVIFCSSAQETSRKIEKELIGDARIHEKFQNLPEFLKSFPDLPSRMPESDYLALAGTVSGGITGEIDMELRKKFNKSQFINELSKTEDILIYTYFQKLLSYDFQFNRRATEFSFGQNSRTTVKSYGISASHKKNGLVYNHLELRYHNTLKNEKQPEEDHHPQRGFIVKLKTISDTDEIYVSTVEPENTMKKTFEKILFMNRSMDTPRNAGLSFAGEGLYRKNPDEDKYYQTEFSRLNIPMIWFDATNKYVRPNEPVFIQRINFCLNEKYDTIAFENSLNNGSSQSDSILIVDRPFVIFIKDMNSNTPYFMAYIGNDELLFKSDVMKK